MTSRPKRKSGGRGTPRRANPRRVRRKSRFLRLPKASTRRRWWRRLRRQRRGVQLALAVAILAIVAILLNWTFHVARKPSELFFPVSGAQYKTPSETWRAYAPLFRKHSTQTITPDFLAALAQVEGSGNPIVRTYWRWSLSLNPFAVYRPASSAVGMYQFTDGTFAQARRFCIHDHKVMQEGPWHQTQSCWFNAFYTRVIPSHAVELTSAYLDHRVATSLSRRRIVHATLAQKQEFAAVIHLCGATAGEGFAARGFSFRRGQKCGSHDPRRYLAKVDEMKNLFARLDRAG
jgi:hypothetical protein